MSNSYVSKSALNRPAEVLSSQTNAPISSIGCPAGARTEFIMDVLVGPVTGTPSLKLQQTLGRNLWDDVKTQALTASINLFVTSVSMTTGELTTSIAHGLSAGTPVVINGPETPGGLLPGVIYYAVPVSSTVTRLAPTSDLASPITSLSTDGTAPLILTQVRPITIKVSAEVDTGLVPLKPHLRVTATTGVGEYVQVVGIQFGVPY